MVKKRKRWYVHIRPAMLFLALMFLCSTPLMISVKAEENSSQTATKTDATTEYESKSGRKVIIKDGKYVFGDNDMVDGITAFVKLGGKWRYVKMGCLIKSTDGFSFRADPEDDTNITTYVTYNETLYTGIRKLNGVTVKYKEGLIVSINGVSIDDIAYTGKSGKRIIYKKNVFCYKGTGEKVDTDFIKIGQKWYLIRYGHGIFTIWQNVIKHYSGWYVVGGNMNKSDGTAIYVKDGIAYTGNISYNGGEWYTGSAAFANSYGNIIYLIDGIAAKSYDSKSGKAVIKSNGKYVYGKTRKTVTKDLVRIGSKLYYIKNGTKQTKKTGKVTVNKLSYYIRKGVAYTGNRTINGAKYYYYDGVKGVYKSKSGRTVVKKNNKYIYVNKKKTIVVSGKIFKVASTTYVKTQEIINSDLVRVNDKLYYIRNGKQQTNTTKTVKINGKSYYIKKGVAYTGYRTVKGVKCYYKDGIKSKATIAHSCKTEGHVWECIDTTQESHAFCHTCGNSIQELSYGTYATHENDCTFAGWAGGRMSVAEVYECMECGKLKIVKIHKGKPTVQSSIS